VELNGLQDFAVPFAEQVTALQGVAGFIIVFFLPGFAWTFVFFSKVSVIERIVLSMGLSIAIVTLGVLVLHVLFGMTITDSTSLITIAVIIVLAVITYFIKRYIRKRMKASGGD
jgi:uncharacterized membrane protein